MAAPGGARRAAAVAEEKAGGEGGRVEAEVEVEGDVGDVSVSAAAPVSSQACR